MNEKIIAHTLNYIYNRVLSVTCQGVTDYLSYSYVRMEGRVYTNQRGVSYPEE
jgi:hypothetical protein